MPPPPPPAPPPAPTGLPKVPKTKANAGGPTDRKALLTSIHSGARLKKTVTNDRSSPLVAGNNNKRSEPPSGGGIGGGGGGGGSTPGGNSGPVGLGGLFAGGIPKLPNKGNSGPPKRAGGPSVPFKLPGGHSNGKLVNGTTAAAPPPPSQSSKPARPVSNINKKRETFENERNLEHKNSPVSHSAHLHKAKVQPPPPPSRPAPAHSSSRPTSMVGRPLPPTPPTLTDSSAPPGPPRSAPPPPPRQTPSVPPGRPSAPPPPVRTTSAQGGGTVGRSGGGVRSQLARRNDPPPPPPPHGGRSHSFSSQHAPVLNKHSTSITSNNSNSFDDRFKFHSVHEFPPPEKPNIGIKTYPSHSPRRASTQQRRAPPPPPPPR